MLEGLQKIGPALRAPSGRRLLGFGIVASDLHHETLHIAMGGARDPPPAVTVQPVTGCVYCTNPEIPDNPHPKDQP